MLGSDVACACVAIPENQEPNGKPHLDEFITPNVPPLTFTSWESESNNPALPKRTPPTHSVRPYRFRVVRQTMEKWLGVTVEHCSLISIID